MIGRTYREFLLGGEKLLVFGAFICFKANSPKLLVNPDTADLKIDPVLYIKYFPTFLPYGITSFQR